MRQPDRSGRTSRDGEDVEASNTQKSSLIEMQLHLRITVTFASTTYCCCPFSEPRVVLSRLVTTGENRLLEQRRRGRVADARAAAGRISFPACRRAIEREAAADDDATIEVPSASEKARHAEMGGFEANSLLVVSEQRAVGRCFELLNYPEGKVR